MSHISKLSKKVWKMEFSNPIMQVLVGLVVFYFGLKMFAGGMKAMGNLDHLAFFIHSPLYMFIGGIVMTLLWQSSSLSTTAIVGLVASGANIGTTGTIWLAGAFVSDGMPKGDTLRIAMAHTGVNLMMALAFLPFCRPIANWITKLTT